MLRGFTNVKSQVETDDVLQASLMRLLRALKTIRPDSMRSFYGLAAEQIRWELLDLARRYRRRVCPRISLEDRPPGAELTSPLEPADPSPEGTELDQWCAFHEAVTHLPPAEREVFSLAFYHGWPQEQIAELLQVSTRQVRRYLHSAYQTIHETIRAEAG
jgi:RNA polymerase sigma-70 factor (ECF subfamily)